MKQTVFDLVVDDEDRSLIADVLADAAHKYRFDCDKLQELLERHYDEEQGREILQGLLAHASGSRVGP